MMAAQALQSCITLTDNTLVVVVSIGKRLLPRGTSATKDAGAAFGGGLVSGFNPYVPRTIFDAFRDYRQEVVRQRSTAKGRSSHSIIKKMTRFFLAGDVETMIKSRPAAEQNKLRTLANLFSPPFDILFKGTFEQSKQAGVSNKKWLLVNIQVPPFDSST